MRSRSNAALFWPVVAVVTVLDVATKAIAEQHLLIPGVAREVVGNALRFRLVYNPGAAFGLHLGQQSRWIFTVLTIAALVILARLYRATPRGDVPRVLALGLVCAGAVGNLLDRLRSGMGVVDFIDVGFGDARWPTFNVADMAVSCGAILLALVLWREDRRMLRAAALAAPTPGTVTAGLAAGADRGELV